MNLVGGFDAFGTGASLSKSITNLPKHFKARVSATVYHIDSWDNEEFKILVDNT